MSEADKARNFAKMYGASDATADRIVANMDFGEMEKRVLVDIETRKTAP